MGNWWLPWYLSRYCLSVGQQERCVYLTPSPAYRALVQEPCQPSRKVANERETNAFLSSAEAAARTCPDRDGGVAGGAAWAVTGSFSASHCVALHASGEPLALVGPASFSTSQVHVNRKARAHLFCDPANPLLPRTHDSEHGGKCAGGGN